MRMAPIVAALDVFAVCLGAKSSELDPLDSVFEIYYDRGVSLGNDKYRKWCVTKQL